MNSKDTSRSFYKLACYLISVTIAIDRKEHTTVNHNIYTIQLKTCLLLCSVDEMHT